MPFSSSIHLLTSSSGSSAASIKLSDMKPQRVRRSSKGNVKSMKATSKVDHRQDIDVSQSMLNRHGFGKAPKSVTRCLKAHAHVGYSHALRCRYSYPACCCLKQSRTHSRPAASLCWCSNSQLARCLYDFAVLREAQSAALARDKSSHEIWVQEGRESLQHRVCTH